MPVVPGLPRCQLRKLGQLRQFCHFRHLRHLRQLCYVRTWLGLTAQSRLECARKMQPHARNVMHDSWATGLLWGGRKRDARTYVTPPPRLLRPRPFGLERSSPGPEAISQVPGESWLAPALEPPWVRCLFSLSRNAFVAIALRSSLAIPLHGCAENVR